MKKPEPRNERLFYEAARVIIERIKKQPMVRMERHDRSNELMPILMSIELKFKKISRKKLAKVVEGLVEERPLTKSHKTDFHTHTGLWSRVVNGKTVFSVRFRRYSDFITLTIY